MNKQKRKIIQLQAKAVRKMVSISPNGLGQLKKDRRLFHKVRGKNYLPLHAYKIASQQPDSVLASVFRGLNDTGRVEKGVPLWHWRTTFHNKMYIIKRFIGDFNDGTLVSP